VAHIPGNPTVSRFVLYYTAISHATGTPCIGVATAGSPAGPFDGAGTPLLCLDGGVQDPSIVVMPTGISFHQLVYKKNGANAGVYNQLLSPDGLALSSSQPSPYLLYTQQGGWWHGGVVERPAIAVADGAAYLFYSGGPRGTNRRATGWSPCSTPFAVIASCSLQTRFGTWLARNDQADSPSGVQVFSDGTSQWIVYDGVASGACSETACSGTRNMRIDKLCFRNGQPRTNGPTAAVESTGRDPDCSVDIPGRQLTLHQAVDDGSVVHQPASVVFRDGGATGPLGGRLFWMFSDTLVTGGESPSNTASRGIRSAQATAPGWTVDSSGGVPSQFIPFTADELTYNQEHNCTTGDCRRVALWERGIVPLPNGDGIAFFIKATCDKTAGSCNDALGVGAVRVRGSDAVADRSPAVSPYACNPTCLFDLSGPLPDYLWGRPVIDGGHVYLYGNHKLARAPIGSVDVPSAWRYWTDTPSWSSSVTDADDVPGLNSGGFDRGAGQVSYNPFLDLYINTVNDHDFVSGRSRAMVQTAPRPEGPWSAEQLLHDAIAMKCPGGGDAQTPYGGVHSPELNAENGRVITVLFARPRWPAGACPGQVRMVTVRLG
jgi:hypothetical protein